MKKPSVSELLDLLNKPALLNWANRIGLEGLTLDHYRKAKMMQGTSIHKEIENCFKNGEPFSNIEWQNNFNTLFENIEILSIEEKIETEWFQGRLDVRFRKDNFIYLADFKSNHKKHYLENILQLTAYKMATNNDKVAIISVPDFKLMPLKIKDFTPYEIILKSLSTIYTQKQLI